jgi:hypothetical protein
VQRRDGLGPAAASVVFLIGCGSHAAAPSPDQNPKVAPMSSNSSHAAVEAVAVGTATVIPWSRLPGAAVVDVGPPTGGAIELPGPRTRPVRPHLEIAAASAGIAARVVQGDGVVAALAVRNDEIVPLPGPPLAVTARTDGIWALYRDSLVHHDRQGTARKTVALSGVALIGSTGDAVWLASNDQAWHVAADGMVHGPFAWRDPLTSFETTGKLCARDRRDPRSLSCLAPDGAHTSLAVPVELAPLEQPIALEANRMITLQGTTVRLRRGADLVGEWTLQVAGLDTAKAGFVVTMTAGQVALWRPVSSAALVARTFTPAGQSALAAASVDGETVVLYGRGHATTHRGSAAASTAPIDESSYRATIFPSAWEMAPVRGIAVRGDGVIAVSASGPAGAAVVELLMPHATTR